MTKESLEQLLVDYGNPEICDDAISRRAAVYVASGFCHPANIATELAKLPPVTPQSKWIPVSERLPENSGEYLVSVVDADAYVDATYYDVKEGKWRELEWNEEVIAWMPLPEPMKEGD